MKLHFIPLVFLLATACQGEISLGDTDDSNAKNNGGTPNNGAVIVNNGGVAVGDKIIDPARVTIHRLNRAEYNNTVRDLLGDISKPADLFPDDDFGYGFNNIADVLSLSPLHLEFYDSTATALIDTALGNSVSTEEKSERFEAETLTGSAGAQTNDGWNLYSNGSITTSYDFPIDGEYKIVVRSYQTKAGADDAQAAIEISGVASQTITVPDLAYTNYERTFTIPAGSRQLSVSFINDAIINGDDRNLYVDYIQIEGPIGAVADPAGPSRERIMTCVPTPGDHEPCATEIISNFAKRAWRRPVEPIQVTELLTLVQLAFDEGDDFETGIRLALRAILVSPNFIFRVEFDDDIEDTTPHPLSAYELASRLSYFIWSSMPDETLFALAESGDLLKPEVLRTEVDRMMDDEKAIALVDGLSTQWLFIDNIDEVTPDPEIFPNWDPALKEDLKIETRLFMKDIFEKNASIQDIILADYTFVNDRLADYYGVTKPAGEGFQRVKFTGEERRGFLTQGGFLTHTSKADRTKPTARGMWVLGNLMCTIPQTADGEVDIPDGTPEIPEELPEGTSLREVLEAHVLLGGDCVACHVTADPIGFGLSNFDGIGNWIDTENGVPVDSSGILPPNKPFNGVFELTNLLSVDPRLNDCLTRKLTIYATGRGMETWDQPLIDLIIENAEDKNLGIRDIFKEIVTSPAFTMRRGGTLLPAGADPITTEGEE